MNVKRDRRMKDMLMVIISRWLLFSSLYFSVDSKFVHWSYIIIKTRKIYLHTHSFENKTDVNLEENNVTNGLNKNL